MTKIDQIPENTGIQVTKKASASKPALFQAALKNAFTKKTGAGPENMQAAALGEPQSLHFNTHHAASADVVNKTDTLLALLESYASGLENPDISLKDLAPLVTRMKDDAQQLLEEADNNPSAGTDIIGIAARTALTASVEYMKFQRGDYI